MVRDCRIQRVAVALLLFCGLALAADDILIADFEGDGYGDWTVEGDAFGSKPARKAFYAQRLSGFQGKGLVNTFNQRKDRDTGSLTSPPFALSRRYLNFLLGGGRHPGKACVNLLVDGKAARTATGFNSDAMRPGSWDVAELKGKQARIQILDQVSGPWGHIDIDQIALSDSRPPKWRPPMPEPKADPTSEFHTEFRYSPTKGMDHDPKWTRRDPSDVIRVGDTYFVWYTKTDKGHSGYDATVWYASSKDGKTWKEEGEALPRGGKDAWDEASVFTPGILAFEGKYYLFYTAIPAHTNLAATPTAIGMALSDSPRGPWQRFEGNPVLTISKDPREFDSFRVDDACLLVREGKVWLYYKGRQAGRSPGETKMGVAIAEKPTGPYVKHPANPLMPGHEVLVWPYREGVASLGCLRPTAIYYAPDGVHFKLETVVRNIPRAAGGFRPDAFADTRRGQGIAWGISQVGRPRPHLVRYDCHLTPAADPAAHTPKDATD